MQAIEHSYTILYARGDLDERVIMKRLLQGARLIHIIDHEKHMAFS